MDLSALMPLQRAQWTKDSLWFWPTAGAAVTFTVTLLLARLPLDPAGPASALWPGDAAAAQTMLQAVAASVITVTSLTFSLTVLALQLASQQFSPRLLRDFARDPVTRIVLAVLVSAFVSALTALRTIREGSPPPYAPVFLVFVLGLASVVAVLAFITHLVRALRVDTMMLSAHDETDEAIGTFYPAYGDERPQHPRPEDLQSDGVHVVPAQTSGFIRAVAVRRLVASAHKQRFRANLLVRPGDHVVRGTPLAMVRSDDGGPPGDPAAAEKAVQSAVHFSYERTIEQDSAFGFRQLEDIAVKALSPGINDPVTAAHAVGHMGDLLVKLTGRRLGPTLHYDSDEVGRVVVPDRDLQYYLDLSCGQVRRYGSKEPTVLGALLRMLRDVAIAARDDHQRAAIGREADLVVAAMDDTLLEDEQQTVRHLRERVQLALEGQTLEAYSDRSGETRSI